MASPNNPASPERDAPERIPPLQNGDRLTRPEFERRYDATPHVTKAELIEGIVFIPSPVCHVDHGRPNFELIAWLGHYCAATHGVEGGAHGSLRLDLDNEPQPDAFLMRLATHGGQAHVDDEGYVAGAPELIAEVAASSVSYDLGVKRHVYRRSGVREYLVWRVLDRAIDWFILREGSYESLAPDAAGIYRSEVFPGLWLDADALIRGDLATVAQTAQQGLASAEHAEYVSHLQQIASQTGDR